MMLRCLDGWLLNSCTACSRGLGQLALLHDCTTIMLIACMVCVLFVALHAHTDCYMGTRFDSGRHCTTSTGTMTPHQHSKAAASEPCHVEVPAFRRTHGDKAQRSPRTARKLHNPQQTAACTRAMSQTVFTQMAKHSGWLLADTPLRVKKRC